VVAINAAESPHGDIWLSILVPAYNVEAYVQECLESLSSEATAGGIEIVVLDDGSTDRTGEIVDHVRAAHPKLVRVERLLQNDGLTKARQRLLKLARGEYLWFVDADDRVRSGALGLLKQIIDRHAPDLVICDFSIVGGMTGRRRRRSKSHVAAFHGAPRQLIADRSALIAGMFGAQKMQVWTKVFKRTILDASIKFPEGRHFEDIAFSPAIALRAGAFYYEPTPWIDYRWTPTGIVATMTPSKYVELTGAFALAARALRPHLATLSQPAIHAFRYLCVKQFIGSLKGLLRYPDDKDRARNLEACFENFSQAVADDGLSLAREFARNGRLRTWLKLVAWKARARKAIRQDAERTPQVSRPDAAV
jgi:hypothetical protein